MPKGQSKNTCIHQASYILHGALRCTVRLRLNGKFIFANSAHLGRKFSLFQLQSRKTAPLLKVHFVHLKTKREKQGFAACPWLSATVHSCGLTRTREQKPMWERTHTADCIGGEARKEEMLLWDSSGRITRMLERIPLSQSDLMPQWDTPCSQDHTGKCVTLPQSNGRTRAEHLHQVFWSPLLSPFRQVGPHSFVEIWVKLHILRKAFSNVSCLGLTWMYLVSPYLSLLTCHRCYTNPHNLLLLSLQLLHVLA